MSKENQIRLLVRQEIMKIDDSLNESAIELKGNNAILPDIFGNLLNKKLTYENNLVFGPVAVSEAYPGKNDNEIILKLPESSDQSFSIEKAIAMGGRTLTDDYFIKGTPFEQELRSSVSTPEALSRITAIAKIKNKKDLDKTRSFNRSKHFFVVVDTNNKFLKNADVLQKQEEKRINPSFLDLIIKDPMGGYGKFISKLPPRERDAFIAALVDINSKLSIISGVGGITAAATTAPAAPLVAGVSGAAAVGPSLALASIAYDKGDKIEAALYLISAVINTWASSAQILEGLQSFGKIGSLVSLEGSLAKIFESLPSIKNIKDLRDFFLSIKSNPKLISDMKKTFESLEKSGIVSKGINEKIMGFAYSLFKNSPKFYDDLVILQDKLKSSLALIFGITADAVGIYFDTMSVAEPIAADQQTKPASSSDILKTKIASAFSVLPAITANVKSMTGKSIGAILPPVGKTLLINYETGESKIIDKLSIGKIIDLDNESEKINLSTENLILAVPDFIFETFEQLKSFPSSFSSTFSGNREKFFKGSKIIYMLDI